MSARYPMRDLHGAAFDFAPRDTLPVTTLMLATVARSGSTHLATELWRTGALGAPLEYLNLADRLRDMVPRLGGGDLIAYWRALQRHRTSPNGVFAFKAFAADFEMLGAMPRLAAEIAWDRVVYLTRRDTLGQALSYARAVQTRHWFDGQSVQREPAYDRAAIERALGWIAAAEAAWERLFAARDVIPLRLHYEDLVADRDGTIARIATSMQVDLATCASVDLPGTHVQRDTTTDDWRRRYHDESTS